MTKLKLLLLIVVVAAFSIALVLQHRSLSRLREENSNLRHQLGQFDQLATENERLSNSLAQARSPLSEDQKRELLRLRAETASFRRHTNDLASLQEENRRLRTARTEAPKISEEEEKEQWKQVAIAKMNDAKLLVLGMMLHAADNPGAMMVTNFNQVTNYLRNPDVAISGTNEFELLYVGDFRALTNPANTIVVREREALQHPNGRWVRAYGFADGHSEYHAAPDGNFEAWEKARLPMPPSNP